MAATIDSGPLDGARRAQHRTALSALACAVALVVPLTLLAAPRSDVVVLVGPAGSDTGDLVRMVAGAGGSILSVGGRQEIVIARSDDDGFVGRLYGAGARLVLDGRLAAGCLGARHGAPLTPRPDFDPGRSAR